MRGMPELRVNILSSVRDASSKVCLTQVNDCYVHVIDVTSE